MDMESPTITRESPAIIRLNIAHYEALLEINIDDKKRSAVTRLIEEAKAKLKIATNSQKR